MLIQPYILFPKEWQEFFADQFPDLWDHNSHLQFGVLVKHGYALTDDFCWLDAMRETIATFSPFNVYTSPIEPYRSSTSGISMKIRGPELWMLNRALEQAVQGFVHPGKEDVSQWLAYSPRCCMRFSEETIPDKERCHEVWLAMLNKFGLHPHFLAEEVSLVCKEKPKAEFRIRETMPFKKLEVAAYE